MVKKYRGFKHSNDVIKSTFGGENQNFIVSGSEGIHFSLSKKIDSRNSISIDATIYAWHRESGLQLEPLTGHERGSVSSLSWNPIDPGMFASCGDDSTVRIWQPKTQSLEEEDEVGSLGGGIGNGDEGEMEMDLGS
jgi:WD repeat-containing protein 26